MPVESPKHARDPGLIALGDAIRSMRLAKGVSQEELAHRAEIDRSYMSSIERGLQNPGVVTIFRIGNALEATAAEIFGRAKV